MPQSLSAIDLNFQQAVKNVVRASFPAAHPVVEGMKILDPAMTSASQNSSLVDSTTGKRVFTLGFSRWGGSRPVGD